MFEWGDIEYEFFHFGALYRHVCTLRDAYEAAQIKPATECPGVTRITPFDSLGGLAIINSTPEAQRYNIPTHIPHLTLGEIWKGEPKLPSKAIDGQEVSITEKISAMGGHPSWVGNHTLHRSLLGGALFRVWPLGLWCRSTHGVLAYTMGLRRNHRGIRRTRLPLPSIARP